MARAPGAAALALAAALAPSVASGQTLLVGASREPGGTILGRVCLDRDGDRRCGEGEPGVAGARVIGEGGEVAVAGADGRFHLLEVPGRILLPDRTAYGGHAVAVEGLGARRALELGPVGAAQVDLAVAAPPAAPPPPLAPAAAGRPPARAPGGRLRWDLGGRTTAGAAVSGPGARAVAAADGTFSIETLLAPGENALALAIVAPDGGAAVHAWTVDLVPRPAGGDLVAPRPPRRVAALRVHPRPGGALVAGEIAPGERLRVGGIAPAIAAGGAFAAWVREGEPELELLDAAGRTLARAALPVAPERGLRAVAALAEVEVSFLGDPGTLVTGRGAGAASARIGPVDVEAGVDLDDRDRHASLADLLRPRDALAVEHALDPETSHWMTGDGAAADDRNAGRGRLWARVVADGARLDLGGARAGLTGGELGRYDRALHGAKARGETALGPLALEASAFGATLRADAGGIAPPAPAHDVLAATGAAAFWLAHGDVVPGSEALRIDWRDPLTGRLADVRPLVRGRDYELDWSTGRVVLARPLATVGGPPSLPTADPFAAPRAALVADYLHAAAASPAEDLHGGRVGAALGPLSASAQLAREERPEGSYRLLGGAATLDLGPHLALRAEAARSRGDLFARGAPGFARSIDGGYAFGAGGVAGDAEAEAVHLEARGAAGPARLDAWWREREAGYSDAAFDEPLDARERGAALSLGEGADGAAGLSGALLWAERRGADLEDPVVRPHEVRHLVARAGWSGGRLGLVAEAVHVDREAPFPAEETSAGARARWRVDPSLALDLSHHQGLRTSGAGRDPTFTAAGASWASGRSALSVRGGWGPTLGPRLLVGGERGGEGEAVYGTFTADPDAPDLLPGGGATSALGVRRRAGAAEIFTEEQFARDPLGLRSARVLGLAVTPLAGLRLSLSGEHGERLLPDGTARDRSAAAGAAGLVRGPVRVALRGEVRREGGDDHAAAGGSAEWAVRPGAVVGLRASFVEGTVSGREALAFEAAVSGALRGDRLSALASLARVVEMRPGEARREGVVARLAGTAQAAARLELGLGAALAVQEVAGARDDRIAGSARGRVRIAGPLDAALEYARRAPLGGGDLGALDAVRAEVGIAERESRLAVGYTLLGFGGDGLTPAADTSRLYVRAQVAY